jgi:hypothetical protein
MAKRFSEKAGVCRKSANLCQKVVHEIDLNLEITISGSQFIVTMAKVGIVQTEEAAFARQRALNKRIIANQRPGKNGLRTLVPWINVENGY